MTRKRSFPLSIFFMVATAAVFSPGASSAHAAGDLAQEYEQVRKIALRDPKVKEAYDRADQRLHEKIVELDPALRSYSPGHAPQQGGFQPPAATATHAPAPTPAPVHPVVHQSAPVAPAPAPHHVTPKAAVAHAPAATGTHRTHVVASGETIAGIASRYQVSAASIETANHITDPRKLQVGQTLIIPGKGSVPPAPAAPAPVSHKAAAAPAASAAPSASSGEAQDGGIWDKLKHSF